MKRINLLPCEQKNRSEKRKFFIVWFGILSLCIIFLFFMKIVLIHQIKKDQLDCDRILPKIKTRSHVIQKLQYEEKELKKIIKNSEINHHQINQISNFITHLKYLITPDIFIRLIEFNPPYLNLIMHAVSERQCLLFIKVLQVKFYPKLHWMIFNLSQDLEVDFIVKLFFENKMGDVSYFKNIMQ